MCWTRLDGNPTWQRSLWRCRSSRWSLGSSSPVRARGCRPTPSVLKRRGHRRVARPGAGVRWLWWCHAQRGGAI